MEGLTKGCCCIELDFFARVVAYISIVVSIFNILGWYILGIHWLYIGAYMLLGPFVIAASVYLLKSISNRDPKYVVPWLVMAIVGLFVTLFNQTIWLTYGRDLITGHEVHVHVFGLFIGFTFLLYVWMCIYSYYQTLCRQSILK